MSTDNYPSTLSYQMKAIVYLLLEIDLRDFITGITKSDFLIPTL